jgi:hypothetical protein
MISIETDDCMGEYNALNERGIESEGEPEVRPYSTGVLVKDLYGNKIYSGSSTTGAGGGTSGRWRGRARER